MHRRFRRAALALLPLLLSGCLKLGGAPAGEVAELVTMGGERPLREPPRPIRGQTRVLIFALDGVGWDDLHQAVGAGRMPHVARVLGAERGEGVYEHACSLSDVLTVLPSSTIAAWASIFTGAPPAETGVMGNEWFVRDETRFYAPVPASVKNRSHAVKLYTDELLSDVLRARTLYEQLPELRSHVSLSPVFRGADLVTVPNLGRLGDLVGAVTGESLAGSVKESPRVARETDETSVASLLESIKERGLPDVQTVYFNGIDLRTHYAEDPVQGQQDYLRTVTDTLVGRVLDAYRSRGALDSTYVLFIADHGHTPVLPDDRHSLGTDGDDEPPAVLQRAGLRVRPFSLSLREGDYQAVLAYQGFMAYVYLADRSTCPDPGERCDWTRPPRLEEDVLPVARAYWEASRSGAGVPALQGTLDLIFVRTPTPDGRGEVRIFDGERLVSIAEYLRRNPRPDLLRLEERMKELAVGPYGSYAGDIILLAKTGTHRPIEERFYFAEPENSEHGSPSPQDSRVPLVVAHPARSGEAVCREVRRALGDRPSQMDVPPLVKALLDQP